MNWWGIFFTFVLPFLLLGFAAVVEKGDKANVRALQREHARRD